jgi:hypothetical protein
MLSYGRCVTLIGMGDFLSSFPGVKWDDIAWVEYYDGDAGLAEGFAQAGDAVLAAWRVGVHPNDKMLLPLIYNYRHAIELALKQAIRQAAACVRFGGRGEPDLWADQVEMHLKYKQGHRLAPLAAQLESLLRRLELDTLPAGTMKMLARLHQLDPTGEAFRYSGHLTTTAHQVDMARLGKTFRDVFDLIHGGVLAMLDAHEELQHDLAEEFQSMYGDESGYW